MSPPSCHKVQHFLMLCIIMSLSLCHKLQHIPTLCIIMSLSLCHKLQHIPTLRLIMSLSSCHKLQLIPTLCIIMSLSLCHMLQHIPHSVSSCLCLHVISSNVLHTVLCHVITYSCKQCQWTPCCALSCHCLPVTSHITPARYPALFVLCAICLHARSNILCTC